MQRDEMLEVIRDGSRDLPGAPGRFLHEIQTAARAAHPNVVMAYDAGSADRTLYFAMEHVAEIDLASLVRLHGPLQSHRACDCARQAALGPAHIDALGLVHRDIEPSKLARPGDDGPRQGL